MSSPCPSQEKETPARDTGGEVENAKKALDFAMAEARRYRIAAKPDTKLDLVEQPILRWSNPTNGEVHGAVMLFVRNGCPEAAASAYRFFSKQQLDVELVSLTESRLTAERNGRRRWSTDSAVTWEDIPGAGTPAESAERRRLQARSLAREFSGDLGDRTGDDQPSRLRLLVRPLHEYQATDGSGREGGLFALATANDPELLLLIESRPEATGRKWVYAAARLNHRRLRLLHGDKEVWTVPEFAKPWGGPEGNYIILQWKTPEDAEQDR